MARLWPERRRARSARRDPGRRELPACVGGPGQLPPGPLLLQPVGSLRIGGPSLRARDAAGRRHLLRAAQLAGLRADDARVAPADGTAAATVPTKSIAPRTCNRSGKLTLSARIAASITPPACRSSRRAAPPRRPWSLRRTDRSGCRLRAAAGGGRRGGCPLQPRSPRAPAPPRSDA